MEQYKYKPKKFYIIAYSFTWLFWLIAILFNEGLSCTLSMLFGLLSPAFTAIIMVFGSKNEKLKKDFKRKIFGFYKLKPLNLLIAIVMFLCIIVISILLSQFFGQSLEQFKFTEDFSFTGAGISSALLTIILASIIEEVSWRGYGEDSIAQYCTWFKESIIFGIVWSLWHFPLFWIPNTYQCGLRELGIGYMINFFLSVMPLGFITTWVYVRNRRSMLANMIFHLFVNFMQEKIAMTPITKCVETFVVFVFAIIIVLTNKDIFFETRHIGKLLEESEDI